MAVVLRRSLLLSLDDLLSVVREFLNPDVSRSGLDWCLRRHGVANLRALVAQTPRPTHKPFKEYEPGYLHVDVKYPPHFAPSATGSSAARKLMNLHGAICSWRLIAPPGSGVRADLPQQDRGQRAPVASRDLDRACPVKITRVLTDNGKEFTDRLFGLRQRAASGEHDFDRLCDDLGIEHRLSPPMHPQTNGMVGRFNGRIEEVLQSHHFISGEDLETTLMRYDHLYNTQLPQAALHARSPLQAMKDWHKLKPAPFKKRPYQLAGCDS